MRIIDDTDAYVIMVRHDEYYCAKGSLAFTPLPYLEGGEPILMLLSEAKEWLPPYNAMRKSIGLPAISYRLFYCLDSSHKHFSKSRRMRSRHVPWKNAISCPECLEELRRKEDDG